MTMVILATGPLLTLIFATAHRLELFQLRGLAGALIALVGIIVAVSQGLGSSIPIASLLAVLVGAACIAEGTVLFKLFPNSIPWRQIPSPPLPARSFC
jgi:drug/metabolite transporter (DMT)-like permease